MSQRSKKQKVPENLKWEGEKNLKFAAKRHDKRFGDISIYNNTRTNQKVMCKEKASGDMKQFGRDVNTARQRMSMQNQYLHKMLGWSTQTKKELCSTHHYVKMFYEYPDSDLRNETAQRKKNKTVLSERELSNATSNALNGLSYLHNKKLAHGDIRPQLISAKRMNSGQEVNKFELLDRLADPSPLVKCQINNMMNNKELFMSPQLWRHINTKGKKKPPFNRQKNDLFALGMSMLSAGNQSSMKNCYKKGGKFDANALNTHLANFNQRYGQNPSLTNVVSSLVTLDEAQRPDTTLMLEKGHRGPTEFVETHYQEAETREDVPFEMAKRTVPQEVEQVQQVEQPMMTFNKKQAVNQVAKEVELAHKNKPAETSKVVTGDDFFSNPAPVYQPYQPQTYVPAEKVEPVTYTQPDTVYVQQEPQVVYTEAPKATYTQPVTTTYVESAPQVTYSQPTTTTYVESAPQVTYSQPTTTTYVESAPQTTYTQPATTTYVESTPVKSEYRSSQPTTVTSNDGSTITYGTPRVVRKYVDHSSRRSFRGGDNSQSFTVNKQPHVETIVSSQPTTTTYTQPTTTTYVESTPQATYTQPTTTTYVESTPQTTYTQPATTTYVQSTPTTTTRVVQGETTYQTSGYTESTPQTSYTVNKKKSTVFHDAQFGDINTNGNGLVQQQEVYTNSQPVTSSEKVVMKKVVVRDGDGNIIEEYEEPVEN